MARQMSLETAQVSGIFVQAIGKYKETFEDELKTPKVPDGFKVSTFGRFIRIRNIFLGDRFGAIDIIFKHDGKIYLLTVEQTINGDYCSAFDPDYRHTAKEIKPKSRKKHYDD